jgi:3-deoxy-manno-octulosonate cytidylyltransferase (CMP-KDO synthetase)
MKGKKICIIIPSRMSSSRFPGKPLIDINGKSMIRRVYEKCRESLADKVIVSTEDEEIYEHVIRFGESDLTPKFDNGTLRVCYTGRNLTGGFDYVINVQGDEPNINTDFLNRFMTDLISISPGTILTGASELKEDQLRDPNSVKLIRHEGRKVLGFTRSPLFYQPKEAFKHVGIYGFCYSDIDTIYKMNPSELSLRDSLEQISWLENGFAMEYTMCHSDAFSVDVPNDLDVAIKYCIP